MDTSKSQLAALTGLFSPGVFRELARFGRSGRLSRLVAQSGLASACGSQATVGDAFDLAFSVLREVGKRDEYVYRAALTQKILLGTHSLKTAAMLAQFRTGESRADLVLLNGTATAYEIKSERDSLARLAKQVDDYRNVFAQVTVIASETHVTTVLETVPDDVGVLCLSSRYRISTERAATNTPERISPAAVFESLRLAESRAILEAIGVPVPRVPNTRAYTTIRSLFAKLDPTAVHLQMVRTLKSMRSLAPLGELIAELPESLQPAALSVGVRRSDHQRLIQAIKTPLHAAVNWS